MRLLGGRAPQMTDRFADVRAALPAGTPWEAGVIPLAGGIASDPTARLAAVLIVADGFILHGDAVSHPPAEIDGIAAIMAGAVHAVVARGAARPPEIRVRHAEIADALAPLLSGAGIVVTHALQLPMLEDAATSMVQAMGGFDEQLPLVSMPNTWKAWGLPDHLISDLFFAAKAFYLAQPWAHLTDEQLLTLDLANGGSWTASVMGNAGQEFGLALYEDSEDVGRIFSARGAREAFMAMRSAVLSLTFSSRPDLPKPMQREVARSGWVIAGPRAYPILWTLNTPGGCITSARMLALTTSLHAVARFATTNSNRLATPGAGEVGLDWRDAESGTVVHRLPGAGPVTRSIWEPPDSLTPSLPEGPNANALAATDDDTGEMSEKEQKLLERFRQRMLVTGGSANRLTSDMESVRLFIIAMTQYQDIPLTAVTEYDLRVFLYDWFPRKVMRGKTAAMQIRGSLRRFFDFLSQDAGIVYPWASAILRDRARYEERWETFPGGFIWDAGVSEWRGELYADLDERAMLPADALADVGQWGDTMGVKEARLHSRLQREWLVWRDELIRAGITDVRQVRAELVIRQQEWERRRRTDLDGQSVSQVVARERLKQSDKASGKHNT